MPLSSILPVSRIYIDHLTSVASSIHISRGDSKNLSSIWKKSPTSTAPLSVYLYNFFRHLKNRIRFVLAGLHSAPKEVFELAKLHDVFEIFPDVAAAMKVNS